MKSFFHLALTCVLACPVAIGQACPDPSAKPDKNAVENGYVTAGDGVRLYYSKVGNGRQTVIIPGRLFLYHDFQQLAAGRTLIFYDMRNRGCSDAVNDPAKISIQNDVKDVEAVRQYFHAEKPDFIGFSYLGMLVVFYATEHPDHAGRIVQLGPVARKFGTPYPKALTAGDEDQVPDPAELKKLNDQYTNGFAKEHPQEYCELEWKTEQQRMVGNPANAGRIASVCEMPNEWPTHLFTHFQTFFTSVQPLDISKQAIAALKVPVLTLHGTKDRNAAYGGGREWDMLLPNARLITIPGAAHMSWVDSPELVFPNIDTFLKGNWPKAAQKVTSLEPASTGNGKPARCE